MHKRKNKNGKPLIEACRFLTVGEGFERRGAPLPARRAGNLIAMGEGSNPRYLAEKENLKELCSP